MPLINKVPFVSGSVYTPEIATEMAGITFDDLPQYYGHFAKIADADLSDAPGSIKTRVAGNDLNLKVTAGAGLNALYAAGRALYANTVFDIAASSVSLVASTTNYVFVGINGLVVSTSALPPIVRALLAIVNTNTTGVVSITDTREGYKLEVIKPIAFTVRNFGGRGDSGAFLALGGELLDEGEYYYTDFTVASGRTITVGKLARIYCTGSVNIAGVVNVTTGALGGAAYIINSPNGAGGGLAGQGFGAATGEQPSNPYTTLVSPVGSGGCSGGYVFVGSPGSQQTARGGDGGGGLIMEAAGNISITGTINANGLSGATANTIGNTTTGAITGASGGGSGGNITLKSLGVIVVSGTLNVLGGNGGNGVVNNAGLGAEGGCAGGGGRVYLGAPNINTTGSTINVNGGLAGGATNVGSTFVCLNTNGGSYGGIGGSAASISGQPGATGVVTIKLITPLG